MMTFRSILAATTAAALTVCAAEAASGATITIANFNSVGPGIYHFGVALSPGDNGNTYDVAFSTTQKLNALLAMQTQNSGPDPIEFELDKYNGTTWIPVIQSGDTPGAVIPALGGTISLGAGSYQLITDHIGVPPNDHGSLDGSITLTSAVPEPATWAMLILGVGLIGFAARRRREGIVLEPDGFRSI